MSVTFLAFGLVGSVIAFIGIGLYFGYGTLTQTISEKWSRIDPTVLASYVVIALAVAVSVLLLGLWDIGGGRHSEHQPKGNALAGCAAIHCHLPRHGQPLMASLYMSAK